MFKKKKKARQNASILHLLLDDVNAVRIGSAGGGLVLLILGYEIEQIGVGVGELVFLHALTGEPVQKSLAFEHDAELLGDALEDLVDHGTVAQKCPRYLQTLGWNVAHRCFHVVRDPVDEIRAVLRLDAQHLVFHLFHRHLTAENRRYREIPAQSLPCYSYSCS